MILAQYYRGFHIIGVEIGVGVEVTLSYPENVRSALGRDCLVTSLILSRTVILATTYRFEER